MPDKSICGVILVLAVGLGFSAVPAGQDRVVVSEEGFSLECPAGWEIHEKARPAAVACVSPKTSDDDFMENLIVMVEQNPDAGDSKEMLDNSLSRNPDHIVAGRGNLKGDRWEASTATIDKRESSRALLVAAIRGEANGYMLLCTAESAERLTEYRPHFEEAIRSFRFEEVPAPAVVKETVPGKSWYSNRSLGIGLHHPSSWEVLEAAVGPSSFAVLSPEDDHSAGFREHLTVIVRDYPSPTDLLELQSVLLPVMEQQYEGFVLHRQETTVLDEWDTLRVTFSGTMTGIRLSGILNVSVRGNRSYMITCLSNEDLDRYRAEFLEILESVEFD